VTFGFVARFPSAAGLRGGRFQAVCSESSSAELRGDPCGMLPQLLPHPHGSKAFAPFRDSAAREPRGNQRGEDRGTGGTLLSIVAEKKSEKAVVARMGKEELSALSRVGGEL
jgi:hypothetical protein